MRALVIVCPNYPKLLIVNYLPTQNLLPDAKILKYITQNLIGCNFAGDFA